MASGLQQRALAAKEIGCVLRAESPGPGRGAISFSNFPGNLPRIHMASNLLAGRRRVLVVDDNRRSTRTS